MQNTGSHWARISLCPILKPWLFNAPQLRRYHSLPTALHLFAFTPNPLAVSEDCFVSKSNKHAITVALAFCFCSLLCSHQRKQQFPFRTLEQGEDGDRLGPICQGQGLFGGGCGVVARKQQVQEIVQSHTLFEFRIKLRLPAPTQLRALTNKTR